MADPTASHASQPLSADGCFRVVYWFPAWVAIFLPFFLYRVDTLKPNWLVLALLAAMPFALSIKSYRDLVNLRSGSTKENTSQIAIIVGAAIAVLSIGYLAWRYNPAFAVRIMDAYVMPAFMPICVAVALVAFRVERRHKVRVFVGNKGWLYLPSNSTAESDARKSGARGSL